MPPIPGWTKIDDHEWEHRETGTVVMVDPGDHFDILIENGSGERRVTVKRDPYRDATYETELFAGGRQLSSCDMSGVRTPPSKFKRKVAYSYMRFYRAGTLPDQLTPMVKNAAR